MHRLLVSRLSQRGAGVEATFLGRPQGDQSPEAALLRELFERLGYQTAVGAGAAASAWCLSVSRGGRIISVDEVTRVLALHPEEIKVVGDAALSALLSEAGASR
jgi:hypothetical protein